MTAQQHDTRPVIADPALAVVSEVDGVTTGAALDAALRRATHPEEALLHRRPGRAMNGGLTIEYTSFGLLLIGFCDAGTAARLDGGLRRWDRARRPCEIDATLVTFADSHGLGPIAEFVRRCRQMRYPDPRLIPGDAVQRVLSALGVDHEPFGLRAWDAAATANPEVSAY